MNHLDEILMLKLIYPIMQQKQISKLYTSIFAIKSNFASFKTKVVPGTLKN